MATTNDDTLEILNNFIETSKDGEYGFRTSAENIESSEIRQLPAARRRMPASRSRSSDPGSAAGWRPRGQWQRRRRLASRLGFSERHPDGPFR